MMDKKSIKSEIVKALGGSEKNTGSTAVQIGLLNERIKTISLHLNSAIHDFHSRAGLMKIVGQRRRLLKYLKRKDLEMYKKLVDFKKGA